MRILALTNLYPSPYQPHRATYNRDFFRILAEDHAIRVIAPILWTDERNAIRSGQSRLPSDRRVETDGILVDHPRYWYSPKMFRSLYGRFFYWSVRHRFHAVVNELRPDVVLASWAYPDGWAAVRLAREAGLPVVVQVLGSDIRMLESCSARASGTANAVRSADAVICVSRELATRVIKIGADPEKVFPIIDGVDISRFCPGDRRLARETVGLREGIRHLLFVGNFAPVKGIDVLLQAISKIALEADPFELHLVGSGPMKPALLQQAKDLGIESRVKFHGTKPHAELPNWFRAADLVVLASRSEGIPNVLQEAAACETPFVATNVGGIPEIAELGASMLVPPEDPDRLGMAIRQMLDSPPPAPKIGPRSRREAVAEMAAVMQSVVAGVKVRSQLTESTVRSLCEATPVGLVDRGV